VARQPVLTKSRQGTPVAGRSRRRLRAKTWACPWWDQALAPTRGSPMYTKGFGARDGVNLGTAVREARNGPVDRRRRTWTHSSTEGRSKGAHAVEFSKTVAPLLERWLLSTWGAPGNRIRLRPPRRTDEYSAENRT
jgi:hypothetical protein